MTVEQAGTRWQPYRFGSYREVHYGEEWQGWVTKACTGEFSRIYGRHVPDEPVTCRKCLRVAGSPR